MRTTIMDNQQLFASVLSECLADYKMTWFEYACKDKGLNPNDVDYEDVSDVLETKYVIPDLIKIGFTEKEAQEISLQQIPEKTALKFMAYFEKRFDDENSNRADLEIALEQLLGPDLKNIPTSVAVKILVVILGAFLMLLYRLSISN